MADNHIDERSSHEDQASRVVRRGLRGARRRAGVGGTASAAVPVRGTFTPVDPERILDTRTGLGVADQRVGPLGIGQVIELDVTGVGGVPVDGVGAVVLNVTVTEAVGNGFVTVYPCGFARPMASNLNFVRGVNAANLVTAKVGVRTAACACSPRTRPTWSADVSGWYADDFASVPGFFYTPADARAHRRHPRRHRPGRASDRSAGRPARSLPSPSPVSVGCPPTATCERSP